MCSNYLKYIILGIAGKLDIKNDEIEEPKLYLGSNFEKFQLPNGKMTWSLTSNSYVQGAVETVHRLLSEDGRTLKSGKRSHKGPLPHGYMPEMDTSDECNT